MNSGNRKYRRRKRLDRGLFPGEHGFSLLETMIALLVMAIVGLGVASLFSYSVRNNSDSSERQLAIAVAQRYMERLRSVPFDDSSLNVGANTDSGVTNAGHTFTVVTTTTYAKDKDNNDILTLKTITLQVTPVGGVGSWAAATFTIMTQRSKDLTGQYFG